MPARVPPSVVASAIAAPPAWAGAALVIAKALSSVVPRVFRTTSATPSALASSVTSPSAFTFAASAAATSAALCPPATSWRKMRASPSIVSVSVQNSPACGVPLRITVLVSSVGQPEAKVTV
jgi:hypothetical protein